MANKLVIPNCNPEVYREAAALVANGRAWYTCYAISEAIRKMAPVLGPGDLRFYQAQYRAMFGPKVNATKIWYSVGSRMFANDGEYSTEDHPYWDLSRYSVSAKRATEARKMRVTALLLMADICEQGF